MRMVYLKATLWIVIYYNLVPGAAYKLPRCSRSCPPQILPNTPFLQNKFQYLYHYSGSSFITTSSSNKTVSKWTSRVHMNWITTCDLYIRISHYDSREHFEDSRITKYPVVAKFKNGLCTRVCSSQEDSEFSLNFKKTLISSIQSDSIFLKAPSIERTTMEKISMGYCTFKYSSMSSNESTIIFKTTNHHSCQMKEHTPMSMLEVIWSKFSSPLSKINIVCQQEISNGTLTNMSWNGVTVFVDPISMSSVTLENNLYLRLMSVRLEDSRPVEIELERSSTIESAIMKNDGTTHVSPLLLKINKFCQRSGSKNFFIEDFWKILQEAQLLSQEELEYLLESLDLQQNCRTSTSLPLLKKLLESVSHGLIDTILNDIHTVKSKKFQSFLLSLPLHLVSNPTRNTLESLRGIILSDRSSPFMRRGAAYAIRNYCEWAENCHSQEDIVLIKQYIEEAIQNCELASSEEKELRLQIIFEIFEVLGHLLPNADVDIMECAKSEVLTVKMRKYAIRSLSYLPCDDERTERLLQIPLNRKREDEIRIEAYQSFIKCGTFQQVASLLNDLTGVADDNVRSFIVSHLQSLQRGKCHHLSINNKLCNQLDLLQIKDNLRSTWSNFHHSFEIPQLNMIFHFIINKIPTNGHVYLEVDVTVTILGTIYQLVRFNTEDIPETNIFFQANSKRTLWDSLIDIGFPRYKLIDKLFNLYSEFQSLENSELNTEDLRNVKDTISWLMKKICLIKTSMFSPFLSFYEQLIDKFEYNTPYVLPIKQILTIPTVSESPWEIYFTSMTMFSVEANPTEVSYMVHPKFLHTTSIVIGKRNHMLEGIVMKFSMESTNIGLSLEDTSLSKEFKIMLQNGLELWKMEFETNMDRLNEDRKESVLEERKSCSTFSPLGISRCLHQTRLQGLFTRKSNFHYKIIPISSIDYISAVYQPTELSRTFRIEAWDFNSNLYGEVEGYITHEPRLIAASIYSSSSDTTDPVHMKIVRRNQNSNTGLLWEFQTYYGKSKASTSTDKVFFTSIGMESLQKSVKYEISAYTSNILKQYVDLSYQLSMTIDAVPPASDPFISLKKLEAKIGSGDLESEMYIRKQKSSRRHQYHFSSKIKLKKDILQNISGDLAFSRIPNKVLLINLLMRAKFGKSREYETHFEYISRRRTLKLLLELNDVAHSKTMFFLSADNHMSKEPVMSHNLQVEAMLSSSSPTIRFITSVLEIGSNLYQLEAEISRGGRILLEVDGPFSLKQTSSEIRHHSSLHVVLLSSEHVILDSFLNYDFDKSFVRARISTEHKVFFSGSLDIASSPLQNSCGASLRVTDALETSFNTKINDKEINYEMDFCMFPGSKKKNAYQFLGQVEFQRQSVLTKVVRSYLGKESVLDADLKYTLDYAKNKYGLRGKAETSAGPYHFHTYISERASGFKDKNWSFNYYLRYPSSKSSEAKIIFGKEVFKERQVFEVSMKRRWMTENFSSTKIRLEMTDHPVLCNSILDLTLETVDEQQRPLHMEVKTDYVMQANTIDLLVLANLDLEPSSETITFSGTLSNIQHDKEITGTSECYTILSSVVKTLENLYQTKASFLLRSKKLYSDKKLYAISIKINDGDTEFYLDRDGDRLWSISYVKTEDDQHTLITKAANRHLEIKANPVSIRQIPSNRYSTDSSSSIICGAECSRNSDAVWNVMVTSEFENLPNLSMDLVSSKTKNSYESVTSVFFQNRARPDLQAHFHYSKADDGNTIAMKLVQAELNPTFDLSLTTLHIDQSTVLRGHIRTNHNEIEIDSYLNATNPTCVQYNLKTTFNENPRQFQFNRCPTFLGMELHGTSSHMQAMFQIDRSIEASMNVLELDDQAVSTPGMSFMLEIIPNGILNVTGLFNTKLPEKIWNTLGKTTMDVAEDFHSITRDVITSLQSNDKYPNDIRKVVWEMLHELYSDIQHLGNNELKHTIHANWNSAMNKLEESTQYFCSVQECLEDFHQSVYSLITAVMPSSVYWKVLYEYLQEELTNIVDNLKKAEHFVVEMMTWSRFLEKSIIWKNIYKKYSVFSNGYLTELKMIQNFFFTGWNFTTNYVSDQWKHENLEKWLFSHIQRCFSAHWNEDSFSANVKIPLSDDWPSLRAYICSFKFKLPICIPS